MNKKSVRNKNVLKGVAFGAALLVCGTSLPLGVISSFAETWTQENTGTGGEIDTNTNRIEVNANAIHTTVEKGGEFEIPQGQYFGKSQTAHIIGTAVSGTITESKVVAYYAADGSVVYDSSDEKYTDVTTFSADRIGQYVIKYSVVDDGQLYTYELKLRCVVGEVTFEFDSNDTKIVPAIYDLSIAEERDILVPIPTITDEHGKEPTNLKVVIDGEEPGQDDYLLITMDQAYSEDVKVARNSDGGYYIAGSSLSGANGYSFDIIYKYYQNGVAISSTKKSFKVNDKYYTNAEKNAGYNLTIALASSKPSSAVVGVARALPSLNATTASTDSPASEAVAISYSIKVQRRVNGAWQDVEGALDEDNNFTAPEAGDYRFVYTATDFYGHEATYEFTILDVVDSLSATPYIYDAGAENVKNEDGSYVSAENLLKSQTVNRNIIMYAIGGSDNHVAEKDLTLTRRIRDAVGNTIYETSDYNQYNLIFNAQKSSDSIGFYQSIYNDNYQIRRQMTLDGQLLDGDSQANETKIKNWLITNNYRIVTNSRTTDVATGEAFNAENTELTDAELLEKGYAYLTPNTSNATFTAQTYRFYYIANDNVATNNAQELYFEVEVVENVDDAVAPSISYSTELQSSYLDEDVITLSAPTASDEGGDGRIEIVTAYRYLNTERAVIDAEGETIKYLINEQSKNGINSSKWYIQADGNNVVTSNGWTILEGEDEYEINLAKKPIDAAYIEFFSYAIDDQGNVGFYNKICYVSNIEDTVAPYLYQVITPDVEGGYVNNETIVLPTLAYKDNLPQYMTAGVVVYRNTEGEDGAITQNIVHSANMTTYYDSITGDYVLEAGTFNAAVGGDYTVAVTVTDAGRHSITTYFTYHVAEVPVIEEPEITNIDSANKEIVIGEAEPLPAPKLAVSNSNEIGYIGISDLDSENTASYYTVSMENAPANDYNLTSTSFTANSRGTYSLRYHVYVISYSTNENYFATSKTNGKLTLEENALTGAQMLVYYADGSEPVTSSTGSPETAVAGEKYYIMTEKTADGYQLRINTSTSKIGKEMPLTSLPTYEDGETSVVTFHHRPSSLITFTAGEVAVNLNMDESYYEKTKFEDTKQSIIVKPIDAEVSGSGELDRDRSNVSISVTTGSTTRTIATISVNEWKNVTDSDLKYDDQGNLTLLLNTNGQYTIKYTVYAKDGMGQPVGSVKEISYTLAVGDVIAPTIEIDNTSNAFLKTTYNVGDVIDFQVDKIDVTDETTVDKNDLLDRLVIQVRNTSTNTTTTLSNSSTVAGEYAYSYKVETEGNYIVSIYVRDSAGNASTTREFSFTVGDDGTSTPVNVQEVVGQVLIGVAAVILAGVVIYFVVSKVKENKSKKK